MTALEKVVLKKSVYNPLKNGYMPTFLVIHLL